MIYNIIENEINIVLNEIIKAISNNDADLVRRLTGKLDGLNFALDQIKKHNIKKHTIE